MKVFLHLFLFLLCDPILAQTSEAQVSGVSSPMFGTKSAREDAFSIRIQKIENAIMSWVARNLNLFLTCVNPLSDEERETVKKKIELKLGTNLTDFKVQKLVEQIPSLGGIVSHLSEHPEWLLNFIEHGTTDSGKRVFVDTIADLQNLIQDDEGGSEYISSGASSQASGFINSDLLSNLDSRPTDFIYKVVEAVDPTAYAGQGKQSMEYSAGTFMSSKDHLIDSQVASSEQGVSSTESSSQSSTDNAASSIDSQVDQITLSSESSGRYGVSSFWSSGVSSQSSDSNSFKEFSSSLLEMEVQIQTAGSPPSSPSGSSADSSLSLPEFSAGSSAGGGPSAMLMGAGLAGADGTSLSSMGLSSSAQLFTGSASSNSVEGGTNGGGCCLPLFLSMALLGVGLAGEYYIANMHIYDTEGKHFEQYVQRTVGEQVDKLKLYLANHPEKLTALKGLSSDDEIEADDDPSILLLREIPLDYKKILQSVKPNADAIEKSEKKAEKVEKTDKKDGKKKVDPKDKKAVREAQIAEAQDGIRKIVPAMLAFFYSGYAAIPPIVNRHFAFYLLIIFLATFVMSIPQTSGA